MSKKNRLLSPDILPKSLWNNASDVLTLPPILVSAFQNLLNKHKLITLALSRNYRDSPVGGITQEETDKHLAQAFDGSCARIQLAVLDPKNHANEASDAFIKCLSGNKLVIIDAPCGAGAATLTFLTLIAELREKNILPRLPLDVIVIGAEIAASARQYAQELSDEILVELAKQGIFLRTEFVRWDATSIPSTTNLIRRTILAGADYPKCLVIIANFSGFLDSKFKDAKPQIQELLRYSSGESSLAIWIEPQTNKVTVKGGLFPKIYEWATTKFAEFIQFGDSALEDQPYATSQAKFQRPINPDETPRVNLAVVSFTLKKPYEQ